MSDFPAMHGDEPGHGPAPTMIYNLVYCSRASAGVDAAEVDRIVATAQRCNPVHGITGVLVHGDGLFFQWLEGPRESVRRLMERLRRDPRHHGVIELSELEEVRERLFPTWDMELVTSEAIRDVLLDAHGTAQDTANADALQALLDQLDAGELGGTKT
jgi:hypothetical protein